MNPRDPLTLRVPRSVRETRRDPYDWWEDSNGVPSHLRGASFEGSRRVQARIRKALEPNAIHLDNSLAARLTRWLCACFGSRRSAR
jgi:hypothetical protein